MINKSSSVQAPILIVEDNTFCHYALAALIEQYQIEYDSACDGIKAEILVKERFKNSGTTYTLILMDLFMPRQDGLKTTQKITNFLEKQGLEHKNLPYICLLTDAYTKLRLDSSSIKELGVKKIVHKPIFKQGLQQLLLEVKLILN